MDRDDLFQLGMGLPSTAQTEVADADAASAQTDERLDFFVRRGGERCAGVHLIVDLWGARRLTDLDHIEQALRDCVAAAGATLLHIHLHRFTPNGGVSGVAVLAESHISVHTWPEADFAAFDVFMCGDTNPQAAVPVLEAALAPERIEVKELLRGRGL